MLFFFDGADDGGEECGLVDGAEWFRFVVDVTGVAGCHFRWVSLGDKVLDVI